MAKDNDARAEEHRTELRNWPYTLHQIDETLDIGLIEGRGRQLLYHSIGARTLTIYSGSGTSMAYGRLAWHEWREKVFGETDELAGAFVDLCEAARLLQLALRDDPAADEDLRVRLEDAERRIGLAMTEVRKLRTTFRLTCRSEEKFRGGDAGPIQLQITGQLHDVLRTYSDLFVDPAEIAWSVPRAPVLGLRRSAEAPTTMPPRLAGLERDYRRAFDCYARLASVPEAWMPFEQMNKRLMADEFVHAELLLLAGLTPPGGTDDVAWQTLRRELRKEFNVVDGVRLRREAATPQSHPVRFEILKAFSFEAVCRLIAMARADPGIARSPWGPAMDDLEAQLEQYQETRENDGRGARVYLTPSSRYLVKVLLTLLAPRLSGEDDGGPKWDRLRATLFMGAPSGKANSRRSIIAERFDVIPRLIHGLGVRRFLSANYDHEVERYLQHTGFEPFDGTDPNPLVRSVGEVGGDIEISAIGASMRDHAFERGAPDKLVTFTAGADGADFAVHHLHGRATEKGRIVATERDYMDLYLKEDGDTEVVREAITLAFSASPILFVGLGMSERDVLRPLRQFISDDDRGAGYRAIVLLPADLPFPQRAQNAAANYVRYGVHTIYYGSGEVVGEDNIRRPIDWLYRITRAISALQDLSKDHAAVASGYKARWGTRAARLAHLVKTVGQVGEDLQTGDIHAETDALWVLCGRAGPPWDKAVELRNCELTSIRPGTTEEARTARQRHTHTPFDAARFTQFYVRQLNVLISMLLGDAPLGARGAAAAMAALDGIYSAALTATLNASLDAISAEQRDWWREWQQSPPHRRARFQTIAAPRGGPERAPGDTSTVLPRRYIRHQVVNSITDLAPAEARLAPAIPAAGAAERSIRQRGATGVRSFDTFLEALVEARVLGDPGAARRIYMVAAKRGLGKGSFMSAFATALGTTAFLEASWPARGSRGAAPPLYVAAMFLNLSFSSEIASVYDMVADALLDATALLEAVPKDRGTETGLANLARAIKRTARGPGSFTLTAFDEKISERRAQIYASLRDVPRLDALKRLAERFRALGAEIVPERSEAAQRPRFLVVINAMDILFTADRQSKNSELEKLLEFLVGEDGRATPFDIVGIGAERRFGKPWPTYRKAGAETPGTVAASRPDQPMVLSHLLRPNLPREAQVSIDLRVKEAELPLPLVGAREQMGSEARAKALAVEIEALRAGRLVQVHFARGANPTAILVENFRPLSAFLFVRSFYERMQNGDYEPADAEVTAKNIETRDARDPFRRANADLSKAWAERPQSAEEVEALRLTRDFYYVARVADLLGPFPHQKPVDGAEICAEGDDVSAAERDAPTRFEAVRAIANATISPPPQDPVRQQAIVQHFTDALRAIYGTDRPAASKDWRDIRRTVGGNRFALTLLLAAAQSLSMRERTFLEAGQVAEQFLQDVLEKLRSASLTKRETIVIEAAFGAYERLHVDDAPETNFVLQQRILRHLAAIGAPVSADVLCRVPALRGALGALDPQRAGRLESSLARTLSAMSERGLLFRLAPHPRLLQLHDCDGSEGDDDPRLEYRYGMHRSIQRHVLMHFGTMTEEPATANTFSPSLYASLASGLARLNHGAYRFLSDLMLSLSQYPDIPVSRGRDATGDFLFRSFSEAPLPTQVQAVRAALSLARSSFSIAVVSRFEDYRGEPGVADRKRSYFEEYRVQLRWIIRKAWLVLDVDKYRETAGTRGERYDPSSEWGQINALYRDEVVWLYNEVGLTCMVEGNLIEAVTHLRQAIELNRLIEGRDESGLQHNRISLNLAIAQIERGRILPAAERIASIMRGEKDANGRLYHLALGYQGLCRQLKGDSDRAAEDLAASYAYLADRLDFRGMAVIGHHRARLLSVRRDPKAEETFRQARRAAEAGGHEDVRRHIVIGEIRWGLTNAEHRSAEERERVQADAIPKLDAVLEYARMMGIRSLQVDALLTRATILLRQNETGLAGRLLVKSIAISRRSGMELRMNRALTVYADVLVRRGKLEMAERILRQSLDIAKRNAHRTEVINVQRSIDALIRRRAGPEHDHEDA